MTFFMTANEHTNTFSAVHNQLEKTHGNYKVITPLNDVITTYCSMSMLFVRFHKLILETSNEQEKKKCKSKQKEEPFMKSH